MKKTLPTPAFTMQFKVRDYEVDCEGIVNNANYLHYMEHTRHEFCASAGLSFARMRELQMSPVVRKVKIEYIRSLGLGEEFTSCLDLRRDGARFVFRQWILNSRGELIVDALVTVVNVIAGRPSRGEEFAEAFADYLN